MTISSSPSSDRSWLERAIVLALLAFTAMAAAGYAIFALHPERLGTARITAMVYGYSLRFFPPGHIIVGAIALGIILTLRTQWAWLPSAIVLYLISLSSEMLGTAVGVPFGAYHYTNGLGIKWFAHVPVLIPVSWYVMALPSYALATRWISINVVWRILAATALLVAWDLALDPAMSRLMPYWVWGNEGRYYGMPLLNLAGWYVTGLALMGALTLLKVDRWLDRVPTMPLVGIYVANVALPVAMSAAAGLWPAAVLAMVPITLAAMLAMSRASHTA